MEHTTRTQTPETSNPVTTEDSNRGGALVWRTADDGRVAAAWVFTTSASIETVDANGVVLVA